MSNNIYPLSYAICDEDVIDSMYEKKHVWAEVVPGFPETYRFGPDDEEEYRKMYAESRFAFTFKKGGWDCLRHYEILASGCIPYFRDLENCPSNTLFNFPKDLIIEANRVLIPWKNTQEYIEKYNNYAEKLLNYTRDNLTAEQNAKYVLNTISNKKTLENPKILFFSCHEGVNYLREFLFIGMNRLSKKLNGECIIHPQLDFLYDDCPLDILRNKHGMGYGYGKKLQKTLQKEINPPKETDIINSIMSHYWNIIIFGKIGPDEGRYGTIPNLPYWQLVQQFYNKDEIIFLYGGDGIQNINLNDKYSQHLNYHSKFAKCFVRELNY
jgi:hypothetical protein